MYPRFFKDTSKSYHDQIRSIENSSRNKQPTSKTSATESLAQHCTFERSVAQRKCTGDKVLYSALGVREIEK